MKPKMSHNVGTSPLPNTHGNIHTYRYHNALAVVTNFSYVKIFGLAKFDEIAKITFHENNRLCSNTHYII